MSGSRTSLYYSLQKSFKNSETKKRSCHSAKSILKDRPELATRIFDKFPCLLPENHIATLKDQFLNIFSSIKDSSIEENINGIELINEKDKKKLFQFEKKIADIAIAELLTIDGQIKPELIKILEWEAFEKQLHSTSLICAIISAFIGAVNQVIIQQLATEMQKRTFVFGAVCDYINKNLHYWVVDRLDSAGYIITGPKSQYESDKWNYEKILTWPIENPQPGVFVVLTAVATAAAILFFKKSKDQAPEIKEEKIELIENPQPSVFVSLTAAATAAILFFKKSKDQAQDIKEEKSEPSKLLNL